MGAACCKAAEDAAEGQGKESLEVTVDDAGAGELAKRKEQQEKWIVNEAYYGRVADKRRGSVISLFQAHKKTEHRVARHEAGSVMYGDAPINEQWMDEAVLDPLDDIPQDVVETLYRGARGEQAMAQISADDFAAIVLPRMKRYVFEDQTTLFEEGAASDFAFIIEDGKVNVVKEGRVASVLHDGDVFNGNTLMNRVAVDAAHVTELRCAIWALDRPTFRTCIRELAERRVEDRTAFLANIEMLKTLTETEREQVAQAMEDITVKSGEMILEQGEQGKSFYVIKAGRIAVEKDGKEIKELKAGAHFGELSLVSNAPISASIFAREDCELMRMMRQDFDLTIGDLSRKRAPYAQRVLNKTPGFCTMHPTTMSELVAMVEVRQIKKGETVLEKGATPEGLYVCSGGRLECVNMTLEEAKRRSRTTMYTMRYTLEPRVIRRGQFFGHNAIFGDAGMDYAIKASIPSEVLFIPLETFDEFIDSIAPVLRCSTVDQQTVEKAIRAVPEFKHLSETEVNVLASALSIVYYYPNEVIHSKGAEMDTFFLVEDGEISLIDDDGNTVSTVGRYEALNVTCLAKTRKAEHKVVSTGYMAALTISKDEFENLLGSLEEIMSGSDEVIKLRCIRNVPLFASLRDHQKKSIAMKLVEKTFEPKATVIKQGEDSDAMYYILDGHVNVQLATSSKLEGSRMSSLNIAELGPGQVFGESALLRDEKRNASVYVKAGKPLRCFVLMKKDMEMGLGRLRDAIQKVQKERAVLTAKKMRDYYGDSFEKHIRFRDLFMVKTIGAGAYGMVRMAKHKGTEQRYAVKILGKERLIETGQMNNIVSERNILGKCNHPNIVKLISVDRDSRHYYMIFEYLRGGELMGLIKTFGRLEEMAARFYVGNVILAFAYLHKQNIVYRDLKPENLLIEGSGYLKIIDFGFAKVVNNRTYTLCGTPAYIAPEVVLSEGHDKAVDYWALGVLIFEMMAGYSPFEEGGGGDLATYERITNGTYNCPKNFSAVSRKLLKALLEVKSAKRLGNLARGITDLTEHEWFKSEEKAFSWEKLKSRELDPPFRPHLSKVSEDDTSLFEVSEVNTGHLKNVGVPSMDTSEWDACF